jgi:hypothetical protein
VGGKGVLIFKTSFFFKALKKTEFRGNSSSWGSYIRVIEKSHIFQQGSFHEIATKELPTPYGYINLRDFLKAFAVGISYPSDRRSTNNN